MSKLDATDIQGFVLRGYALPFARYMFLEVLDPGNGRAFVKALLGLITTGESWDRDISTNEKIKPQSTVNIAFTHRGMVRLELPDPSLLSFPVEFIQGMKARREILGDTGKNDPANWDAVWREGKVDIWLAVNSQSSETLEARCAELLSLMAQTQGARLLDAQDAGALKINGAYTPNEHFGYRDGFGNPDYLGVEPTASPARGSLAPMASGRRWLQVNFCWATPTKRASCRWRQFRTCWRITAPSWCTAKCIRT